MSLSISILVTSAMFGKPIPAETQYLLFRIAMRIIHAFMDPAVI